MILVIDNYDSFVHNLARYVRQLTDADVVVKRNDDIDSVAVPSAVIISPGPCGPDQAGDCLSYVRDNFESVPILGVCLGHQIIVQALGGKVVRSNQPRHGKESLISHQNNPLFKNVPSPFSAGRYHSLIANPDQLPECIQVTAQIEDSTIMAVAHKLLPVFGLQFHPESVLTEHGYQILSNFLSIAGCAALPQTEKAIFS